MKDKVNLHYLIEGTDFMSAGEASADVKRVLKQIGFDSDIIRRAAIVMYEGELNIVIHAGGGEVDVDIDENEIAINFIDYGPGIDNVELAMKEGYSTAPDNVRALGFGAGMGLPNMKKYSDEFKIQTAKGKGTTVYAKIKVT